MTLGGHGGLAPERAAPRARAWQPGGLSAVGCSANPADISQPDINKGGLEQGRELPRHCGEARTSPRRGDSEVCLILPCLFLIHTRAKAMLSTVAAAPGLSHPLP